MSGTIETHTEPLPTARSVIVACNGVAVIRFVAGSIFMTRPFSALATHTAPPAKTTDVAASGVRMRFVTPPLAGSTRTVSGPRATHTDPAPTAMPDELRMAVAPDRHGEALRDPPARTIQTHEPGPVAPR